MLHQVQTCFFYQQIGNGNIANQIHGFTIDYGKFILIYYSKGYELGAAQFMTFHFHL